MSSTKPSLEDEIVEWLVSLIQAETLSEQLADIDKIQTIAESFEQDHCIPTFGVDRLARRASARAACQVFEQLSALDLIAVNKSISLTTGEVLRPDILCFNPYSRTLVVFEVKRDRLTERQAATELAGYEQELRNTLPFLGDFDINFVIVSTQWDSLLDHAIANFNTWSSKQCLALVVTATQPFQLRCRLPEAWRLGGGVGLPEAALQTMDIALYTEEAPNDADPPKALITATQAMARAGDRHGAHGFVLLWSGLTLDGHKQWGWTLCGIDSLAMHTWCNEQGLPTRPSDITRYLNDFAAANPPQIPGIAFKIAKEAFSLLPPTYSPQFETTGSWSAKQAQLRQQAIPYYFEFWGAVGDYAREFVSHVGVRNRYMSYLAQGDMDWTHPLVAMPLLNTISGNIPFPEGVVRCSDAFKAGIALGLIETLAGLIAPPPEAGHPLKAMQEWAFLEALHVSIELSEIYKASTTITQAPPPLSYPMEFRVSSVKALSHWILTELLGPDYPLHQASFVLGHKGAFFFCQWFMPEAQKAFVRAQGMTLVPRVLAILEQLSQQAAITTDSVVSLMAPLAGCASTATVEELKDSWSRLTPLELLTRFSQHGCLVLDRLVSAVPHTLSPFPPLLIDWDGLQQSINEMYEAGYSHPAIIRSPNGQYGVGHLKHPATLLPAIQNRELEVYFMDLQAGCSIAAKCLWVNLKRDIAGYEVK